MWSPSTAVLGHHWIMLGQMEGRVRPDFPQCVTAVWKKNTACFLYLKIIIMIKSSASTLRQFQLQTEMRFSSRMAAALPDAFEAAGPLWTSLSEGTRNCCLQGGREAKLASGTQPDPTAWGVWDIQRRKEGENLWKEERAHVWQTDNKTDVKCSESQ